MSKFRFQNYCHFFVATLVTLASTGLTGCSDRAAGDGGKELNIGFIPGKFDISVVNIGSPEAEGRTLDIHVNGEPPAGFKSSFTFPALQQTVLIHLDELANAEGKRFSPTDPITSLWIGGSGYKFTNYAK